MFSEWIAALCDATSCQIDSVSVTMQSTSPDKHCLSTFLLYSECAAQCGLNGLSKLVQCALDFGAIYMCIHVCVLREG